MVETELALALWSTVPEAQAVMYSPTVCGCGGRGARLDRRHHAEKCFQSAA